MPGLPMQGNTPDDEYRQMLLDELRRQAAARGDTTGLTAADQAASLGNVRWNDDEAMRQAWDTHNGAISRSDAAMQSDVMGAYANRRDMAQADWLAAHAGGSGGSGGGGGHGGSGGDTAPAYLQPAAPPMMTAAQAASALGAGLAPSMPIMPTRVTGSIRLTGPGRTTPPGPAAIASAKAAVKKAVGGPQASKSWMGL